MVSFALQKLFSFLLPNVFVSSAFGGKFQKEIIAKTDVKELTTYVFF